MHKALKRTFGVSRNSFVSASCPMSKFSSKKQKSTKHKKRTFGVSRNPVVSAARPISKFASKKQKMHQTPKRTFGVSRKSVVSAACPISKFASKKQNMHKATETHVSRQPQLCRFGSVPYFQVCIEKTKNAQDTKNARLASAGTLIFLSSFLLLHASAWPFFQ